MAQILTIAKKVAGALGTKVKVPVLDAELKLPPEVLRIVGAVAAGAIIESGSNANGQYIKYADGGLICTNTPVLLGYAIPPGSTLVGNWSYPASFVSAPAISLTYEGLYGEYIRAATVDVSQISVPFYLLSDYTQTVTLNIRLSEVAIGRWK